MIEKDTNLGLVSQSNTVEPIDSTGNNNVFSPNLVDCFTNETENFFEPNENGHYLLKEGNNWYILNEKKEKLSTTAFEYLIPYEGGMYLGKVKHTLFYLDYENGVERYFDVSTGKPLPKNSNDAEVTPSKKITDIQERTFHLSGSEDIVLDRVIANFIYKYFQYVGNKDTNKIDFKKRKEASQDYHKVIRFLHGAYKYFYEGKMNVLLWGKEDRIWDTLLDWKELRERLPLIYLSLHQLKNVKTVVLDQQKEVLGYVEQVENKFGYKDSDGNWVIEPTLDEFRGPDEQGNIVLNYGGKYYFIKSKFMFPEHYFDDIIGPDSNGNYLARDQENFLFINKHGELLFVDDWDNLNYKEINNIRVSLFTKIQGPDINGNYIIQYNDVYGFLTKDGCVKFLDLQQIVPADNLGNYEIKKGFSKGLINKEGDELIPCDFSSLTLDIQNNYLCSTEKGKQIFFPTCTTFSKIYTNISPNATSYLVEQHDLFGLLNQQGKEIVSFYSYSYIGTPDSNALREVIKVVNRCAICGLINDAGIEIIPPQFYKIIDNKDGTYCGENELSYVTFNKDGNINMNIPKT